MTDFKAVCCPTCGKEKTKPKNWTRMSIWRRDEYLKNPTRCRSCQSIKHGMSRTRLMRTYANMLERCGIYKTTNESVKKHYLEKNIRLCDEWRDFEIFAKWAFENGYRDDLTIDRKENSKGYSPENCRWVTMADNLRNRDCVKLSFEIADEIRELRKGGATMTAIAARFGIAQSGVSKICAGTRWAR